MHDKRKKQLEEMTVEERLEKIHKMSRKDLNYLLELDSSDNVLSAKELEAIYNEKDKQSNRSNQAIKVGSIVVVAGAVLSGVLDIIGHSLDKS